MLVVAGIDVGKDSLEVCVDDGPAKRFDNSTAGIRVLVDWLKEHDVSEAAYEPTGGYERQLVRQLDEAGLIPRMVHPIRMRSLARARGFEAKTDGLDAQVLSLYGRTFPMTDTQRGKPDPERAELRDLLRRRRQLVNQRVQELNRLDKGITKGSRASTKRHIAWLDDEIARLDKEYKKALQSSSELSRRAALYQSVQGVGILTSAILAADLPELGEGDGKCLTSLVGLAPWSRDSGRQRGYRAIRGGRGTVRRALYMAALSLIRSNNSALARFYNRLKKRGKPGKVALVAVMRKLLLQLHAIARRGTPWVENYVPATQ
jgi:transposase